MLASRLPRLTFTVALLCVSLTAHAQEYTQSVNELYVKSGMAKQTTQISQDAAATVNQLKQQYQDVPIPPGLFDGMADAIREAYAPDKLRETVMKDLSSLSAPDIAATLKWLDSPLGKQITKLEEDGSSYEAQLAIQTYAAALADAPADPAYAGQIEELIELLDVVNFSVDMILSTQLVMGATVLALNNTYNVDLLPTLAARMNAARPAMVEPVRQQVTVSFLYIYQSLDRAQLQAYLDFLATPAGRHYSTASSEGFKKAMLQASRRMGKAIGTALETERGKRPA